MDYRQQLENEYNEMIARIKEMTAENDKIIARTSRILESTKKTNEEERRHEARIVY